MVVMSPTARLPLRLRMGMSSPRGDGSYGVWLWNLAKELARDLHTEAVLLPFVDVLPEGGARVVDMIPDDAKVVLWLVSSSVLETYGVWYKYLKNSNDKALHVIVCVDMRPRMRPCLIPEAFPFNDTFRQVLVDDIFKPGRSWLWMVQGEHPEEHFTTYRFPWKDVLSKYMRYLKHEEGRRGYWMWEAVKVAYPALFDDDSLSIPPSYGKVVFVGGMYARKRHVERLYLPLVEAGFSVDVYGNGWEQSRLAPVHRGIFIGNTRDILQGTVSMAIVEDICSKVGEHVPKPFEIVGGGGVSLSMEKMRAYGLGRFLPEWSFVNEENVVDRVRYVFDHWQESRREQMELLRELVDNSVGISHQAIMNALNDESMRFTETTLASLKEDLIRYYRDNGYEEVARMIEDPRYARVDRSHFASCRRCGKRIYLKKKSRHHILCKECGGAGKDLKTVPL